MAKHPEREKPDVDVHASHPVRGNANTGALVGGNVNAANGNQAEGTRKIRFIRDVEYDGGGISYEARSFKADETVELPHSSANHWVRKKVAVEMNDDTEAKSEEDIQRENREREEAENKAAAERAAREGPTEVATTENQGVAGRATRHPPADKAVHGRGK